MPQQQNTRLREVPTKETLEQKLDRIAELLQRLDHRDKVRTFWTTVRSIIGLLPLLLILGGAIYVYWKREDFFHAFTQTIITNIQQQARKPDMFLKQLEQFLQ